MKKILALLVVMSLAVLYACSENRGSFGQGSVSSANLTKNNYRVLKTGMSGESSGFNFLWITIVPPSAADAKQEMYDKLKAEGIDIRGRAIALANATEDRGGVNLIIFGIPTIKLTADIIEFVEEKPDAKSSDSQHPAPQPK